MNSIPLKDICGEEVLSRANIKKIYNLIDTETEIIDFVDVLFISRSVADELCDILEQHKTLSVVNVCEKIGIMLEIVKKGRQMPRVYRRSPKKSITIRCETMEDVRKALSNTI